MELYSSNGTDNKGEFRLVDTLSEHQADQLSKRYAMLEMTADEEEDGLLVGEESGGIGTATESFGCWWFDDTTCCGLGCDCGPVSLLEVLEGSDVSEHQGIIAAHVAHVSQLWDHYWSGEGLISHTSNEIRSACPNCIVVGLEHVSWLWAAASQLSSELGEALAAYHSSVTIGAPRWASGL